MRQDSTLMYTNGGLTWHVSILLRNKKPLPFSEEYDNHIECIMGIGPDILVFLDYYTKVGSGGICMVFLIPRWVVVVYAWCSSYQGG